MAAILFASGVSCAKKSRRLYLPAEGSAVSIELLTPVGVSTGTSLTFTDVCHGTKSFLVSVALESSTSGWDYRFLLAGDGTLQGCSTGACTGTGIRTNLGKPARVMFEGIDVDAAFYASAPDFNVVCRGIADSSIGMGEISAIPVPTPSPSSSKLPPQISLDVAVKIPILRIGEMTPTFTTAGPIGYHQGAASLSLSAARTGTGGVIVAGGNDVTPSTDLFEFLPWKIGTYPASAKLQVARGGAGAVGFVDSAGQPAVLFFGGTQMPGSAPANSVEVYRRGGTVTELLPSYGGAVLRGTSGFYLPRHREAGVNLPAVALVGGDGGPWFQFFFPTAPVDLTTCLPGSAVGGATLCSRGFGVAMGDGGHEHGVFAQLAGAQADRLFIGMGRISGGTISDKSYIFDPETYGYVAAPAATAKFEFSNISVPTASLSPAYVGFFGGGDQFAGVTSGWGFVRVADGSTVVGPGPMKSGYAETSTALLDGRVLLLTGGADEHGVSIFVPNAGTATSGTFSFLTRFDQSGTCVTGSEAACVRTIIPRSFTRTVRVDGSSTWLNGAVYVVGGADSGFHATELFIPAYACSGTTPVRPDGVTPVEGVDYCDRGRAVQPITDPEHPVKLAP